MKDVLATKLSVNKRKTHVRVIKKFAGSSVYITEATYKNQKVKKKE